MNIKAKYILDRLREPSTWAGIAALGAVFGIEAVIINSVAQAVMGVAGVAAILLKEQGNG